MGGGLGWVQSSGSQPVVEVKKFKKKKIYESRTGKQPLITYSRLSRQEM